MIEAATTDAVVFDLDGTLLDTLQDLADSANAALEQLGLPSHPVDAYRHFVGQGMPNLAQRILPDHMQDAATAGRCLDLVRSAYAQRWDHTSRPYEGVAEVLDALTERGVPIAILSNKPHDFTELTVQRLLSPWTFARVQGVDDDTPPKPDPRGALQLLQDLGADAARSLYVGDTQVDMQTAAAAGMISVGVTWGFRDEDELRRHRARFVLHHPRQLLDLT